jgi:hypothetical protein
MLGIVCALPHWRCYLEGAEYSVNSDHLDHTWFASEKAQNLSRRQAKWMEWLQSITVLLIFSEKKARLTPLTPCHGGQTLLLCLLCMTPHC